MPSNVVHIRLDNETLLSVLEYNNKYVPVNKNTPLATQTAGVIKSCMRSLRSMGLINSYHHKEINGRLITQLDQVKFMDIGPEFNPVTVDKSNDFIIESEEVLDEAMLNNIINEPDNQEQDEQVESPRDKLRELIKDGIAQVTQPDIALDPKVFYPDPADIPDIDDFKLDIEAVAMLTDEAFDVIDDYDDRKHELIILIENPQQNEEDKLTIEIEEITLKILYNFTSLEDSYKRHGVVFYADIKKHVTRYVKAKHDNNHPKNNVDIYNDP